MLIDLQGEVGVHIDEEFLGLFEVGVGRVIFPWIGAGVPDLRPTE